jgi:hypothetical protein
MKVFIDGENEWYPVYTISADQHVDGDPSTELSNEEWDSYQRMRKQFWQWQQRLARAYHPQATTAIFDDAPGDDE